LGSIKQLFFFYLLFLRLTEPHTEHLRLIFLSLIKRVLFFCLLFLRLSKIHAKHLRLFLLSGV
jgi:hypothetical protein